MQLIEDDIRAEVQASSWIESRETTLEQILIKPEGTFRRAFTKDVLSVDFAETENGTNVTVQISREGLYDMLPEGLFHQAQQKSQKSTEEAVEETERYRKEEKAARLFFLPLEQEFYRQRIWVDGTELKYWLTSTHPENIKTLFTFWHLNPKLFTPRQSKIILSLLPHLHRIVGDIQLIAQGLSLLLGEEVKISTQESRLQTIPEDCLSCLGSIELGLDFIPGINWLDDEPSLLVHIGPVKRNRIHSFLPEGKHTGLLSSLYRFFFPAEVEVDTMVIPLEEESEFILPGSNNYSLLGYSTVI